jgi:antitoxin (DNA-binding transcriptional repressor) of toxin-antitoxin stability system
MKTATVRQVQHDLASVLQWVSAGQAVGVTRRGRVVARILPAEGHGDAPPPVDCVARARATWGPKPAGTTLSAVIRQDRESGR